MRQAFVQTSPPPPDLSFAEQHWPAPDHLHALMRDYGVVHLRGYYRDDPAFQAYVSDLSWAAAALMRAAGLDPDAAPDLPSRLRLLHAHDAEAATKIYLLGTQPMQLASGNAWKFSPRTMALARAVLGPRARLGTPSAGDSLLAHHPGEANRRYVLPIHQDYPYLLQSEQMITFWVPLSDPAPGVGGLTVWPTSHRGGLLPAHPDQYGHLEADVPAEADYPCLRLLDWAAGDVVLMHGALLHRGDHNLSPNRVRLLQLFRYTDLDQPVATRTGWAARTYKRPNMVYDDILPLFGEP